MEQLIKLLQGLLDGEFELEEYTRSNQENDKKTTTTSFQFVVVDRNKFTPEDSGSSKEYFPQ